MNKAVIGGIIGGVIAVAGIISFFNRKKTELNFKSTEVKPTEVVVEPTEKVLVTEDSITEEPLSVSEMVDAIVNNDGVGRDGSSVGIIIPPIDVAAFIMSPDIKDSSIAEVSLNMDSPTFAEETVDLVKLVNESGGTSITTPNGIRVRRVKISKTKREEP